MSLPRTPNNLRPIAGLVDRIAVPVVTYAIVSAILPHLSVPIRSIWRDLTPFLGAVIVSCGIAISPGGGLGLRLAGLRLAREDGQPLPASARCLIELVWLGVTFGPIPALFMLVNVFTVSITGRSILDPLFRTRIVGVGGPVGAEPAPTFVPVPPLPVPDTVTEVSGRPVASGMLRVASTGLDFLSFNAVVGLGYLLPATGLLASGAVVNTSGKLDVAALVSAALGGIASVVVFTAVYLVAQLVLLVGWSTTIGKVVLGLRVVSRGGGTASIGRRLLRILLVVGALVVPFGPLIVLVALGAAYARGRLPFHDRLSGTVVVRSR